MKNALYFLKIQKYNPSVNVYVQGRQKVSTASLFPHFLVTALFQMWNKLVVS